MSFDAVRALLDEHERNEKKFRNSVGRFLESLHIDIQEIRALEGKDADMAMKIVLLKMAEIEGVFVRYQEEGLLG